MNDIEQKIKILEEKLLQTDMRANPKILQDLLSYDFEEIGSNGCISSRDDVIDWLVNKEKDVRWSLEEFRVKQLAPDMVIAIYKATKTQHTGTSPKGSIRSSVWKQNDSGWQMIFHQGTKIINS